MFAICFCLKIPILFLLVPVNPEVCLTACENKPAPVAELVTLFPAQKALS